MTGELDDLDLCLLAWREAPAMLERFHASVAVAVGPGWRGTAILAENAPPAATRQAAERLVAASYPSARRVALRLGSNLGYARAMDLALDAGTGRYAALLNSDGRPEPDMLRRLVAALEEHPGAMWAAPAVHGPGEENQPPGPPYPERRVAGTALVVRREEFLALGGFDPLYYFYSEDYDASDRVRAAGRTLLRVPEAVFHHGKGGRSRQGRLAREALYALTDQTLVLHRDPSVASAVRRLAVGRPRALRSHLGSPRDLAAVAGISAASLALPLSAVAAAARRRRPWDGMRLEAWLARHRGRVERVELG